MRSRVIAAMVGLALIVSLAPLLAHHSVSPLYDICDTIRLLGTVTQVDWKNPHVDFRLEVKEESSAIVTSTNWNVETLGPVQLGRIGLKSDFIKFGDHISTDVFVTKDGTRNAATRSLTFPGGRTVEVQVGAGELKELKLADQPQCRIESPR
jgi:hypothetical protein